MQRRTLLQAGLAATLLPASTAWAASPVIEVYKSETCACCEAWVEHLKENGFRVKVRNVPKPGDYRKKFRVPYELGSCHTAVVAGYAIEGHVPAREIRRLLASRPKAIGLAVPGMPHGAPGMEGMENSRKDPYDVLLIRPDGRHEVYRHYGA